VDLTFLGKRVHISPIQGTFESSVTKICALLGLPAGIVARSAMLSGHDELLKLFSY